MDLLHIHHRLTLLHNRLTNALQDDTFLSTSHFNEELTNITSNTTLTSKKKRIKKREMIIKNK